MGDEKLLREIGSRIHTRRKELGFTQELLAEKMEVSVQMISNLELGKKAIRPENLVKLCRVLQVSADAILTGTRSEREVSRFMNTYAQLSAEDQELVEALCERLSGKSNGGF